MFNSLLKVFGVKTKTRAQRAFPRPRPTFRPRLEALEERMVPSGDIYYWRPAVPDVNWNTAGNWLNNTTGRVATAAPDATTKVVFDNLSNTYAVISSGATGNCSMVTTSGWDGTLSLDNGTLKISGINAMGAVSVWNTGAITTGSGTGWVDVVGGTLQYNAASVNGSNTLPMTVFIERNGLLKFEVNFETLGASLKIGSGTDGTISPGAVSFLQTGAVTCTGSTTSISVMSDVDYKGTLNLGAPGGTANGMLLESKINSTGDIFENNGFKLGMVEGVPLKVLGGRLVVDDTGDATIVGDVSVVNAALVMGLTPNKYSTLSISGLLTLNNSQYIYDVNDLSQTQSDKVTADSVRLDSTDTSKCWTWGGAPALPSYDFEPLSSGTDKFNGEFGTYVWAGTGYPWAEGYTADGFYLTF